MITKYHAWSWIPTLYFTEGLPFFAVTTMSTVMYQNLGLSDAEIAFYTSWLGTPWVIKPIWSPFIDLIKTKRFWVLSMQAIMAAAFACVAFFLPTTYFFKATMAFFALLAFSSATHDIAADGYYMLVLSPKEQSFFVGIRNTFYRCGSIFGQGVLVMIAGLLTEGKIFPSLKGNAVLSWAIVFYLLAALLIGLFLLHYFIMPKNNNDRPQTNVSTKQLMINFVETVVLFFKKDGIGLALFFILTYRLGESQLVKISQLFVLASPEKGGLGLSTTKVGLVYGTIGVIALLTGGIVAGIMISRKGLKYWIFPMALCINVPDILYILLAWTQCSSLWLVIPCIIIEQFGYGIGFAAYMLYLIYISSGIHKTAHYAIATGLMAAGLSFPGMIAGHLKDMVGYTHFFVIVCLCTIPGIIASLYIKKQLPNSFGKE